MKKIMLFLSMSYMLTGCSVIGYFIPSVRVYNSEMDGKSELAHAEYSKKVQLADAEGKLLAAEYLAKSDIKRAEGVAAANKLIGESLKGNEAYLHWLYIEQLREKTGSQVIYVPTEANLPIMEATRHGNK